MRRLLLILLFCSGPSYACDFCSDSVRLTSERAACFSESYSAALEKLASSGRDFVQVDLDGCTKAREERNKSVGEIVPEAEVDRYAFLTEEQLTCVKAEIERHENTFDPERLVFLSDVC